MGGSRACSSGSRKSGSITCRGLELAAARVELLVLLSTLPGESTLMVMALRKGLELVTAKKYKAFALVVREESVLNQMLGALQRVASCMSYGAGLTE